MSNADLKTPVTLTSAQFRELVTRAVAPKPDYTRQAAAARLGLSATEFRRIEAREGFPIVRHNPRSRRGDRIPYDVIEAYRAARIVTCPADAVKLVDARRTRKPWADGETVAAAWRSA